MSFHLGTLNISSGVDTTFEAPNDGVKAILIGCEAGLTCRVTMESGGVQKILYPGTVDWFQVNKGFNGNIKIHPITILNNVATFPASTLIFDAISINDPEQVSMYPLALPSRNTNIGNQVSTVGGGANYIQNDNNASSTSIVESTVQGDTLSAVSITNNGQTVIGSNLHPGYLQVRGVTNNNDDLIFDASTGILTIQNKALINLIIANTGNDLTLAVATGHKIALQVNSADVADINANGIDLLSGAFNPKLSPVTVNGSVSGSASLYQYMQGTVKRTLVFLNNYKSAAAQSLALPVSYSNVSYWIVSEMQGGQAEAVSGGVSQTFSVLVALALAGGTQNPQAALKSWSQGMCRSGFDTVKVTSTTSATTSVILIEGT